MNTHGPYQQLRMVYLKQLLKTPPQVQLPNGYSLRTYRTGDETRFYEVMAIAGWQGWNVDKLQPWLPRILSGGWFMIADDASDKIVATAMALRDMSEFGPVGGELGWLASDSAHAGKGLGMAVSAAVTGRLIQEGYRHIHLYTEPWRLAALKTYLKLGYVPFLYTPEMPEHWQTICEQLHWEFTPERWKV
jgi:mycothiol synthase